MENWQQPNESWLSGKYEINGEKVEINTSLSYCAFGDSWFFQGDEANNIISEIHQIWVNGDCSEEKAIEQWINSNLY